MGRTRIASQARGNTTICKFPGSHPMRAGKKKGGEECRRGHDGKRSGIRQEREQAPHAAMPRPDHVPQARIVGEDAGTSS